MESEPPDESCEHRKERNFPNLILNVNTISTTNQPILVVQSPKTPTLSRKLKAVSLDSEPQNENNLQKTSSNLDINRDVFSMPNTPKRQIKPQKLLTIEFNNQTIDNNDDKQLKCFSTNLKKYASNSSISGSLKTLPEVMTLQDFTSENSKIETSSQIKIKPKGLLERRGSNASLTIDLGSNSNISDLKIQTTTNFLRLNTAKSVSNLNLTSFGTTTNNLNEKCLCLKTQLLENGKKWEQRRKSQETCGNCIIYESVASKNDVCKTKCQIKQRRCVCSASKCRRRKSLSNENLYVPPCGFCQNDDITSVTTSLGECKGFKTCKGNRKAHYPRQPDIEVNQLLSEDFKSHLQNMQYLQTAGCLLSIDELKEICQDHRVPKLHQEFWEVPLNLQEKCYVSGSQNKNRYRGVLPNEHSRVHLPGVQNYIHANYIKGPDYTDTAYIATQGPMAHTCQDFWNMIWHTNCHIIVMLTSLVEKGKNKCELYFPVGTNENDKFYVKTTSKLRDKFTFDGVLRQNYDEEDIIEYEAKDEVIFGNFKIKFIREDKNLKDCPLRYFELSKINSTGSEKDEKRIIRHYWFTNWQDHKMADPKIVLDVALNVLEIFDKIIETNRDELKNSKNPFDKPARFTGTCKNNNNNENPFDVVKLKRNVTTLKSGLIGVGGGGVAPNCGSVSMKNQKKTNDERRRSMENLKIPLVVHCSAGIGRTGCFLAILNGIQQLKMNNNVDVLAILCSLRLNRGGMVQTAEQYELIHRVLNLYTEYL